MPDAKSSAFAEVGVDVALPRGEHCQIRPLQPGDEAMLRAMFAQCCASDAYLRCFAAMKTFPDSMALLFAHLDPDAEIALVATPPTGAPQEILGVAHVILEHPGARTAEFDVMVRSDRQGHGIGYALMTALLHDAKARGFAVITGYILMENRSMLQMTAELGFTVERISGGVAEVRLQLGA